MITQTPEGCVSFRVFMPDAQRVQLVGTFTGWRDRAIDMQREDGGWWCADMPLQAGDYEFQYLVNDQTWLADYAAGGLRLNSYGTWVSLLHIGEEHQALDPLRFESSTIGEQRREMAARVAA